MLVTRENLNSAMAKLADSQAKAEQGMDTKRGDDFHMGKYNSPLALAVKESSVQQWI